MGHANVDKKSIRLDESFQTRRVAAASRDVAFGVGSSMGSTYGYEA
jgi:hypothetical protein